MNSSLPSQQLPQQPQVLFSNFTSEHQPSSQRTVVIVPSGGAVETTPGGQYVVSGNNTIIISGDLTKYSRSYYPLLVAGIISMLFSIIFGLIGVVYACK